VFDALKTKAGVNAFSELDFIAALLADFGMKNVSSDGYNNMLAIVNVAFEGVSRCPNGTDTWSQSLRLPVRSLPPVLHQCIAYLIRSFFFTELRPTFQDSLRDRAGVRLCVALRPLLLQFLANTQEMDGLTIQQLVDTAERIQNETRIGSPF